MTKKLPQNWDEAIANMIRCEQTKGQNVHQHCLSVLDHFKELSDYLNGVYSLHRKWKLPDWFEQYKDQILKNIDYHLEPYIQYHDIGKPYCRVVDKDGVHYPNHAEVSRYVYLMLGGPNEIVANLIGWDMVIHTASAEEIKHYCENEWDCNDACNLLIAAICEIHSNARMFGGIDSNSFKIKWKQIDRRGKQICKYYFD